MASREHYEFVVTVPAGTAKTAPVTTSTKFPFRIVDEIRWRVPPGALGLMGFYIGMRGVQVIPANAGGFLVASGESSAWPLRDQPTSGDWSVTAYNTGVQPHSVYVTYLVSLIERPPPPLVLVPALALSQPFDARGRPRTITGGELDYGGQ
jgi:hypothetical protein